MVQAEQLLTLNFIKNLRKANQESITITKPRGYKMKGVLVASKERYCWIKLICLSPCKLLHRAGSPVPSIQGMCWKLGCHLDPHIMKKEDQLEGWSIPGAEPITKSPILSSFHWHLFWTTKTFTSEMQALMSVKLLELQENHIWTRSVSSTVMWWDKSGHADYIRRVLSCLGGTPQADDQQIMATWHWVKNKNLSPDEPQGGGWVHSNEQAH